MMARSADLVLPGKQLLLDAAQPLLLVEALPANGHMATSADVQFGSKLSTPASPLPSLHPRTTQLQWQGLS